MGLSRIGRSLTRLLLVTSFVMGGAVAVGAQESDTSRLVDVIEITGVIDPANADFLQERLDGAQDDDVHAVILEIDTPGGLDVSMREIIQDILDSDVPVIAWVAPRGARAASAGTFIVYASHLAYMSEATEIGAATPVNLAGDTDETLERKVTNDAVALITELATERGRNEEFAEDAVREGASIGATEAAEIGAVEGIASSLNEVLEAADGAEVEAGGAPVVLDTWDDTTDRLSVTLRFQQMNVLQKLLHAITTPEMAYFLLLIGAFGIIFELYNPGIGLAGIVGAGSLLLAFYGLSVLPTNWVGVGFIVISVGFLLADLQTGGFGILTAGGVASLIVGASLLFSGADPSLSLSPIAIALGVVLALVFFISVMTAALRVRLRRPITGEEAVVGTIGEARTDIAPEGTVFTKGTLWRARTMETGIARGSKVKVMATEGLVLLVEPLHDHEEA